MTKRKDIKTILIIGAGPIVIGQACEFDYSGTQACSALKNEEDSLPELCEWIAKVMQKNNFSYEVLLIDDGSKDNSYNLITQFIQNFKTNNRIKIKVIKSKRNLGKGSALKLGVKKAKHSWILTTDIDMSVSLFQFSNWVKKKLIHRKYFVYFGSRTHKESIVKRNIVRNMLGNVMTFCTSIILNIKIKDTQCGYKLYKKKIAKLIFSKLKNCGFEHDVELVLEGTFVEKRV